MRKPSLLQYLQAVILILALLPTSAVAQEDKPPPINIDELIGEIQKSITEPDYTGIVWWVPVEFWEASAEQSNASATQISDQFKPLRDYIMVIIVAGKIGAFGGITFVEQNKLRAGVFLRDSHKENFRPLELEKVSPDAKILASLMKPILGNALGAFGENVEVFFFSATDSRGQPIGDPRKKGSFSIVLKDIFEEKGESVYTFQLPLNTFSPPKYCPKGGKRMRVDWNYCPWHGVPRDTFLDSPPGP